MSRPLLLSTLIAAALTAGCTTPAEVECMPGWSLCGSTCANVLSDSLNCGSCGNACASDESCVSGACAADCSKQLHAPISDPWGTSWDGLERPRATHGTALGDCAAIGGRLPTLSELHRVSAVKTGAVGDGYKINLLWSLTPSGPSSHMAMQLSNGTTAANADTTTTNYRCVCPTAAPAAFTGGACQGPPDAECFTFSGDATLAYDSWDRPLATKAAAIWDCAFSGGRLAQPERLAAALLAGLPNGSNVALHTDDQESGTNGASLKWSSTTWAASGNVSPLAPGTLSPFRCVGPRNAGTVSASSVAGGVVAPATGVVADGADRTAGSFPVAVDACFDAGGHLPTASELAAVAMQGLPRTASAGSFLWAGDETGGGGATGYSWAGIAPWPGVSGATVSTLGFEATTWINSFAKTGSNLFRCIYYRVDPSYTGPAACNGVCKRYDLTGGRGSGPAATIWIDSVDRDPALYGDAVYACASLGGRLASARDLVEGIKNGLDGGGAAVMTSDVCTGSASIYAMASWSGNSNDSYQDPGATALASSATGKYRCMWTNEIR